MKLLKRKTRKAIKKQFKKAINKHGPEIAAGLIGGLASTLMTLANTDEDGSGKTKVGKLAKKVEGAFNGEPVVKGA
jgi:hypothetical protein